MPLTRPKRCWNLHHHNANYNVAAAMFMIEIVEQHLIVGDALQLLCTSWSIIGHKMCTTSNVVSISGYKLSKSNPMQYVHAQD